MRKINEVVMFVEKNGHSTSKKKKKRRKKTTRLNSHTMEELTNVMIAAKFAFFFVLFRNICMYVCV